MYLRRLLTERVRRRHEALRIYEPLPVQLEFHQADARQRVLRGSNRGGKTLPAAVEVARAITGQDPYRKYPLTDGRCYVVGRDLKHCAETMWHKLYRPGAFKMIKDLLTGQWRAFRPWDPADLVREPEAKKAPPLIPHRMIKSIAWENKAKCIPSKVVLKNGWEIDFFSSDAKPRRGVDIDLWWIDEELTNEEWHSELVARILDRHGKGIWSATPQSGNDALLALSERARDEAEAGNASVKEFVILLMENPHVSQHEKEEFIKGLSEYDVQVRVMGEFAQAQRKVFPEWDRKLHMWPAFQVPSGWSVYASVDPGRQVCAVLFAAVPPRGDSELEGDFVYFFDELYIRNCTAELFGRKMRDKLAGKQIEAFLIDKHGARLVDIGGGKSVELQYMEALRKYKVKSRRTGSGFYPASADIDGGIEAARSWLRIREDGTTRLRVFDRGMEKFLYEVERYRNKVVNGHLTDKPEDRGPVHQMANFRYLASFDPQFRSVPGKPGNGNAALAAFLAKEERHRKKHGGSGRVMLGPSNSQGRLDP